MIYVRTRTSLLLASLGAAFALAASAAHTQTALPIPVATVYSGEPSTTTYNSTTAGGSVCSGALNTYGDGCPATQAWLGYPIGMHRDTAGNIFTADFYDGEFRVIYQSGTALATAIVAANPQYSSFTPTAGNIYGFGRRTSKITAVSGVYYCSGTSGTAALDAYGSSCPATEAYFYPRDITTDAGGNIFVTTTQSSSSLGIPRVWVIFVGDTSTTAASAATTAAQGIITAYNPSVTSPKAGYIYGLSTGTGTLTSEDFGWTNNLQGIDNIAVDSNENIYVSDNTTSIATVSGSANLGATTTGDQVKKFSATALTTANSAGSTAGWVTYIPGTTTSAQANPSLPYGDGGPPSSALVDGPSTLALDANNNLYIADGADRRYRVVYNGGATPPLYVGGTNTIVTPTTGYIYTVAGAVASTTSPNNFSYSNEITGVDGVVPTSYAVGQAPEASKALMDYTDGLGVDSLGNVYLAVAPYQSGYTTNSIWLLKLAVTTGEVTILGGNSTNGYTGTSYGFTGTAANGINPAAGDDCGYNTTAGPTMTDAYGDGCPSTEVSPIVTGNARMYVDTTGNIYQIDSIGSSSYAGIVREYTYPQNFPALTIGSSVTQAVPVTFAKTVYSTTAPTITSSNTEFVDSGAGTTDFCFTSNTNNQASSVTTCVYNITFTPSSPGYQSSTLTFASGTTAIAGTVTLAGTGLAASVSTTTSLATNSVAYGAAASVVATVTATSGGATPTGSVTLTIDSTTTATQTLSNGSYTFSLTGLPAGTHTLSASYTPGSSAFTASSTTSNTSLLIAQATLTVTAVCSSRIYGAPNACSAATVTGYQYTDSASTVFSAAPGSTTAATRTSVAGNDTSTPTAGTLTTAGENNYTETLVNGSFTITGGAPQAIIFAPLANLTHGATYQLTARTTSGLPVTYTVTAGNSIASVSGTTLTITGTGLITIQASQSTDPTGDYAAATPVSVTFTAR